MTFLQLINDVLARLGESSVPSVSTSDYSTLIGKFVNDAKKQVENAWKWNVLRTLKTVNTVAGTSNYTVTGSGVRPTHVTVNNTTSKYPLRNAPIQWILDQQDLATNTNQPPSYYAWYGNNGTDSKVEIFPTPDGVYVLRFEMYVPQVDLSNDADVLSIHSEAVIAGAYAKALVERGEDGGLSSSEAYSLYKGVLADLIAMESSNFTENDCWEPV